MSFGTYAAMQIFRDIPVYSSRTIINHILHALQKCGFGEFNTVANMLLFVADTKFRINVYLWKKKVISFSINISSWHCICSHLGKRFFGIWGVLGCCGFAPLLSAAMKPRIFSWRSMIV